MDRPPSDRRRRWRLATPLVLAAAGALLVTSAVTSGGTDLRAGRYSSLTDLARTESRRVTALRAQVADLRRDIDALGAGLDGDRLSALQAEVEALQAPAGLGAVRGPGVTVTLDDAPEAVRDSAGTQVANTIVHQQDLQAVVTALWNGGAEAMTVQGQRVISTTGIKCVGNTVILHGVPYSPPYVVSAVGPAGSMRGSLSRSPYIAAYLQAVEAYQLGWDVRRDRSIGAPAYGGTVGLEYAEAPGSARPTGSS